LQIGVLPEHCALVLHCTQVCVVALHAGVAPVQATVSVVVHCTHVPAPVPVRMQAGAVADAHACGVPEPRLPSQATHDPAEQIGVAPEQSPLPRHCTHTSVVVLHTGVGIEQVVLSRHCTHWCVPVLHFGVTPPQFVSSTQPAVHVLVARLQMPFAPVHCAFDVHCTQRFVVVLQTGRPAGHAVTLALEHCTHAPEPRHAGFPFVGHANG
jgi:hypothetical protein